MTGRGRHGRWAPILIALGLCGSAHAAAPARIELEWHQAGGVERILRVEDGALGLHQSRRKWVRVPVEAAFVERLTGLATRTVGVAPCGAPLAGWLTSGGVRHDLGEPGNWRRFGAAARVMLARAQGGDVIAAETECAPLALGIDADHLGRAGQPSAPTPALALLYDAFAAATGARDRAAILYRLALLPGEAFYQSWLVATLPDTPEAELLLTLHGARLVREVADPDQARALLAHFDREVGAAPAGERADLEWQRSELLLALGDETQAAAARHRYYAAQARDDLAQREDASGTRLAAAQAIAHEPVARSLEHAEALTVLATAYDERTADRVGPDAGAASPLAALFMLRAAHFARRLDRSPAPAGKRHPAPSPARAILERWAPALFARPFHSWPVRAELELCDLAEHLRHLEPGDSAEIWQSDLRRLVEFGNYRDAETLVARVRASLGGARAQADLVHGDALAAVEQRDAAAAAYTRARREGSTEAAARLAALDQPRPEIADGEAAPAITLLLAGQVGPARMQLAALAARPGATPTALAALAAAVDRDGSKPLADLLAARALFRAGSDPDALASLVETWTRLDTRRADARSALTLALAVAPDRPRLLADQARLALAEDDLPLAQRAVAAALLSTPLEQGMNELRRQALAASRPAFAQNAPTR